MIIPSRRKNPLNQKWVLLSPHRMSRPWTGKMESINEDSQPGYERSCFLCPGNTRTSGEKNPQYSDTYVFPNDFAALVSEKGNIDQNDTLFSEESVSGTCEVICYSPHHDKNLMHLSIDGIVKVLKTFQDRYRTLGQKSNIDHVQIFESRGKEVGNSNLHPHAQVWAQSGIPTFMQEELNAQELYFTEHRKPLLLDYAHKELQNEERVVYQNDSFVIVVPFWAEWPYELLILPRFSCQSLLDLLPKHLEDLAHCFSVVTRGYAQLFHRPQYGAPYMLGLHQRPTDTKEYPGFQFHIHVISPMLTPDRQKFQAGYEKYAEPQRDLTPESAAKAIRQVIQSL